MREMSSVFIQTYSRSCKYIPTMIFMVFKFCSMPYNGQGTFQGEMTGQFRFLRYLEDTVLFLGVIVHELVLEVVRGDV
jgi:hypothetical protein